MDAEQQKAGEVSDLQQSKSQELELRTSGWKSSKVDLVWILAETLWAFTETDLFLLS